jgi:hypothetical protein
LEKDDSTNRSGGGAGLMHLKFIQHQRLTAIRKANYKKVDTLFIKIGVFMNEKINPAVLRNYLEALDDPRIDSTKKHALIDILIISICGVICGAKTWIDIEDFEKSKQQWFSTFLNLENGIT